MTGDDAADLPIFDDEWDPLQTSLRENDHWTTTNLGEAVPGVITPLALAHWGYRGHVPAMVAAHAVGVMSRSERDSVLPVDARTTRCFYGRIATQLEYTAMIGDRIPGLTGEEAIRSLFGKAPAGMTFNPTKRRYPVIAYKFPYTMATIPKKLRAMCDDTDRYWRREVDRIPSLDLPAVLAVARESFERYQFAMSTHVTAMFGSFKPIFDALEQLVQLAGTGDLSILSGTGGAEMAVVTDIWRASRGEITVADIVRAHGFHGPGEGEVSSVVWRDDPSPLETVVRHYRALPDSEDPRRIEAQRADQIEAETAKVLAALPRKNRPGARLLLKLARKRIPDRGRGKRAFLQSIDVGRAAARRAGELLVADGVLDRPDDTFYLLDDELTGTLPADVRDLVARRRERREQYRAVEFAETSWAGLPELRRVGSHVPADDGAAIEGTGASAGVAEGRVRVIIDPSFEDVEPGEILVASCTDPSWCSIMYVSSALVIDLGGMLSHAAVVARELGLPCVVNTRDATVRLHTGDRVRVDGSAGTVEVLERAQV